MTITQHTRRRVLEVLPAEGAPLRVLSEKSGVHLSNVRTIASLLIGDGQVVGLRAGTGKNSKHELWLFPTVQTMETWYAEWKAEVQRREKARQAGRLAVRCELRRKARETDGRAERIAAAAEAREAKKRAKRAEAAEKAAAEKLERQATQKRLRKETAAAGAKVFKPGTTSPKPPKTAWADLPSSIPEGLEIEMGECKLTARHEPKPDEVPPLFSSLRPGQYIAPAPAWLEAIAA